ncbi:hypothetical protein HDU97_006499 [Phlyctochytrium planicorne]|nr:hypothetical protein HDU97_006499 [Phlyctochytrium planicorne]
MQHQQQHILNTVAANSPTSTARLQPHVATVPNSKNPLKSGRNHLATHAFKDRSRSKRLNEDLALSLMKTMAEAASVKLWAKSHFVKAETSSKKRKPKRKQQQQLQQKEQHQQERGQTSFLVAPASALTLENGQGIDSRVVEAQTVDQDNLQISTPNANPSGALEKPAASIRTSSKKRKASEAFTEKEALKLVKVNDGISMLNDKNAIREETPNLSPKQSSEGLQGTIEEATTSIPASVTVTLEITEIACEAAVTETVTIPSANQARVLTEFEDSDDPVKAFDFEWILLEPVFKPEPSESEFWTTLF